jgi:hypothetical protein
MPLYRAQSSRHLKSQSGSFDNPYLTRLRNPKDTPLPIHQAAGAWFSESFGLDYRSRSLFCTSDINIAMGYLSEKSSLIKIIPEGDFSICFSRLCTDLYGALQFSGLIFDPNDTSNIKHKLNQLQFEEYKNEGLEVASNAKVEVMLFAKSYKYEKLA